MPEPPNSSETVTPSRPSRPSFFHISAGNSFLWSIAAARGASSMAHILRTVSRKASSSSVNFGSSMEVAGKLSGAAARAAG